jgi:hypothetical protein
MAYNPDPQIKALEQEIEGLRTKCELLDIKVRSTKKLMIANKDWVVMHLQQFPEHGYDPWMFERQFLQKALELYFSKPASKRLI